MNWNYCVKVTNKSILCNFVKLYFNTLLNLKILSWIKVCESTIACTSDNLITHAPEGVEGFVFGSVCMFVCLLLGERNSPSMLVGSVCMFVCLYVCLFVCARSTGQSSWAISSKFYGHIGLGPTEPWKVFDPDPDTDPDLADIWKFLYHCEIGQFFI